MAESHIDRTAPSAVTPGLIALAAWDKMDCYEHFPKEAVVYNMNFLKASGDKYYSITFPRAADVINFVGLTIIRKTEDTKMNIIDVELRIGDITVFQIPYSLLETLYTVKHDDKVTTINCDFSMFIQSIKLIRLAFHEVTLVVHTRDSSNIAIIGVALENIMMESNDRRKLADKEYTGGCIQYIEAAPNSSVEACEIGDERKGYSYKYNLALKGRSKGFFIYCDAGIKNIWAFKLYVGFTLDDGSVTDSPYMYYGKSMLAHIGVPISDKVLYIPFNRSENATYKENSLRSYKTGVAFSRLDKSYIEIYTLDKIETPLIYSLAGNVLQIQSGMANLLNDKAPEPTHDDPNDPKRWSRVNAGIKEGMCSGQVYCKCSSCEYTADPTVVINYFNCTDKRECPKCNVSWSDWTQYTNKDPVMAKAATATATADISGDSK